MEILMYVPGIGEIDADQLNPVMDVYEDTVIFV
jgi:hypothetical protein